MAQEPQSQNLLLPVLLVFALLFALLVFPPLGALVGVLSPFPLVFIFLQRGKQVALVLMALIFGVLWFLVGQSQALLFMAEYAVMALVLGEMIRARFPGDWCIGASSLVSGVVSILLLVALLGDQETTVKDFFEKQIRAHFVQSIETFESVGENKAEIADMKEFVDKTVGGFASSYPAFVLVGSLISAIANYSLLRIVWGRIYGPGLFSERTFAEWVCPENLVWGFIAASLALFLGQGMLEDAGLNLFIVMMVIYFAQGMSIVVHFLKARKVPIFLWLVLFIIIFVQPLFIALIAGMGVFDIWVDFRKIRNPLPSEDA
ncbi:MAG: DUF2232 domain-containing protein [Nitrospinae bacterium]|nr:DUF2232 domain-containing protein [Nitrospinota bacterium]